MKLGRPNFPLWILFASLSAATPSLVAEDRVVKLMPADGPLDNPLKGWCTYADAGEIHQPYSMVFFYAAWNQLEPQPGDYRFQQWEESWDVPAAAGKHVVFRIYVDYPSKADGLPTWLRDAGVQQTPYDDHGGGLSPDYNDPKMVAAMERLIAALGKRYDQHPRIAFIQLGLLGFWGEWHTWPREEMYASPETERRIIDAYHQAFPNTSLMVRYARDHAGDQPWIGYHDDMFPQDTDNGEEWGFLAGIRRSGRTNNWQRAVIGGEMVPHQASKWLGPQFDFTMEMLKRSHFTWIGPYSPALQRPPSAEFVRHSEQIVRTMGYEFQLTHVKHPVEVHKNQPMQIALAGNNIGVAPFYYPWPVEWALLDAEGDLMDHRKVSWDIRKWMPGSFVERSQVMFDVPAGTYQLAVGIRDPWQDRPAIGFANRLETSEGWAIVSELRVTE